MGYVKEIGDVAKQKYKTGDVAYKTGDVANLVNMNQRHHRSKSTGFIFIWRRTRLEAA